MVAPDIHSSGDGGDFSPSSISTNLPPKPEKESIVPISPEEHKPPEFLPLKESPTPEQEEDEVVKAVTVKEEEDNDDYEEEVNGFSTVDCDGFSNKTSSSSSSSVHLPKPMEGLHETGPPPFLKKTFEMVEDPETNSTVSWSKNGDSFTVWDAYEFSKHLLPKYFKHSNFSSFIRQLNTYGFRKIDPDKWEFANEGFRGGKKHLLRNIKRRSRCNKQQQGAGNGYGVDSAQLDLESQIGSLKNDQDQLRVEIHKLRHQQKESENILNTFEQRIQSAHCKQLQMFLFLVKAAKDRSFLQNLLGKIKQKKELNGREFCKKRRLLHTQFPESLADDKAASQSVNCRNQAQEHLASMQTQLTEILGEDTEQGKTMPKLFETPLSNEFCSPIQDHKGNMMCDSNEQESVYHLMSEKLLDDGVVPQSSADEDLDVNDSKFYLELEDLIGKPRTWGGYATELAGRI